MSLTGHVLLMICALLAIGLPVATLALWPRVRGARPVRGLQRLLLIGGCQVTAVALLALLVNNSFGFYTSWADLLGRSGGGFVVGGAQLLPTQRSTEAHRVDQAFRRHRLSTGGAVLDVTIHGRRSGVSAPAMVYLPPEYAQPRYRHTRFPVVTVMPGYPGNPLMWLHHLPLPTLMKQEVDRRGATPFVAVIVKETVAPPRDTECADVVGGPKVETFLAQDVRSQVAAVLRVRTDRAGWSLMGDSTGGFCATKIAMRHPQLYASAVSLSGYYSALLDRTTGPLYGGSAALRNQSSPLWRLRHLPAPPIDLLATISRQERTYPQTQALLAAARPPMRVTSVVAATGGHNTRNWSRMLPRAIDWLGARFGPLTADPVGAARAPVPRTAAVQSLSLVGLGDSVVSGSRCDCTPFVQLYARRTADGTRQPVRSRNLGVPGQTSAGLLASLRDHSEAARAVARANVVTVTIGANDMVPARRDFEDGGCDDCFGPRAQTLRRHADALLDRISELRRGRRTEVLVTTYWNVFEEPEPGEVHPAGYLAMAEQATRRTNAALCGAAARARVVCVDLNRPFRPSGGRVPLTLLAADGDHPSAEGHAVIAATLARHGWRELGPPTS